MNKKNNSIETLKTLLKTLFQFDSTELDFGIYRIMNYRRKEIENFIQNDLIRTVEKEFERYKTQSGKELSEKIQEKKKEIERLEKDLGEKILRNGEIEEKFKERPFAKEYLELKKQLDDIEITESTQNQVFNDLYNFFSRYYEDGDFISKRRLSSKQHKYAIPYDGEEVKLYWANFDQYYVKTGEVFRDYEFNLKSWRITFRTIFAEVEAGNVKGERRYFILHPDEPVKVDKDQKSCLIQFEYRPFTDEDFKHYRVKTKAGEEKKTGIKQEDLNIILKDKILGQIKEIELKAFLSQKQGSDERSESDEKSFLEAHLYKYTRKITSDFFIHKNLKGFLDRELDYFIKSEIIDLNNLEPRHITRAKVVEGIGKRIIEFLYQIEDFQKMLWEKKKFVLRTDYVITFDRIPEEFQKEILANKKQLKEWEELGFEIATPLARNDKKRESLRGAERRSNPKLPIDTKHFDNSFKERLIEKLSEQENFDDLIDGILIKSENWQELNLILEKYRGKIHCIYIDPPFNTGTNEFLYKNNYLDSSWISMMYDRLDLGRKTLKDDGSIFVRIDYHGNHYVRNLMDIVFGNENFRNEMQVSRISKQDPKIKKFNTSTDSLFFYSNTDRILFKLLFKKMLKAKLERWHAMDSQGQGQPLYIFGYLIEPPKGRHWTYGQENIKKFEEDRKIRIVCKDCGFIHLLGKWEGCPKCKNKNNVRVEYFLPPTEEKQIDSNWTDISGYTSNWDFPTENSEPLLQRVLEASSNKNNWVLDYFLGSGTTIAVAHKLLRKWIGVEMGDFFENIPMRRMKEVLAGKGNHEPCGISKEVHWQGGGFFKYHYLEQYEDTLHNIAFPQAEKGQKALELFGKGEEGNEYLMKYFLKYETDESPSLLNLRQFENPFEYKLKIISGNKGEEIINVDLVETFNYLIGIKVNKYKFRHENGRKYVFVLGEKDNKKVTVVWRSTKACPERNEGTLDPEKDKEFIEKTIGDYNPEEIFINGDAFYPRGYKVIETEFKALMGA